MLALQFSSLIFEAPRIICEQFRATTFIAANTVALFTS